MNRYGELQRCTVVSEEPAGDGFGEAALKLAPHFRMSIEAIPNTSKASIPIQFVPDEVEGPPLRAPRFKSDRRWPMPPAGPYLPEIAYRMGKGGEAEIDCRVEASAALRNCKLVSESPSGLSFGAAALKMAEKDWMTAGPPPDGLAAPADGVWRFRVVYPAYQLQRER